MGKYNEFISQSANPSIQVTARDGNGGFSSQQTFRFLSQQTTHQKGHQPGVHAELKTNPGSSDPCIQQSHSLPSSLPQTSRSYALTLTQKLMQNKESSQERKKGRPEAL